MEYCYGTRLAAILAAATLLASADGMPSHRPNFALPEDGRDAMDCMKLVDRSDGSLGMGRRFLHNQCEVAVELYWCYNGSDNDECATNRGNLWTIGAGKARPVDPARPIVWAACRGANTIKVEKGSGGQRFSCTAPVGSGSGRSSASYESASDADGSGRGDPDAPQGGASAVRSAGNGAAPGAGLGAELATPPRLLGQLITPDDYPLSSMRQEEQGTVTYLAVILPSGAAESCTIVRSSGFPALDAKTCALVLGRARFEPGRAADGSPVRVSITQNVRWSLD